MDQTTSAERLAGITVGDLRRQLANYPDEADLFFGGLTFYRLRGANLVQLEFDQQVYRTDEGTLIVEDVK